MREKAKLVAVCILVLVAVSTFVQYLPEAPQHESLSIFPSGTISALSGPQLDSDPCGGGGGDDGDGPFPR